MDRGDLVTIGLVFGQPGAELARPVRAAVFVQEQGVPPALEWDEHDARSLHALAIDRHGHPVGTGRLTPEGRIGRMAVLTAWRGCGVGSKLLHGLLQEQQRRRWPAAHLHAQLTAAEFYRQRGFASVGEPFQEAGIGHVLMYFQPGVARLG